MHKLLIFHDQVSSIQKLSKLFEQDYHCLGATSAGEALSLLEQHVVSVLIAEERLNTSDFIKQTVEIAPLVVRVQLSAESNVDVLISALNSGLLHSHIQTPVSNEAMRLAIQRAVVRYEETKRLRSLIGSNARLELRVRQSKLTFVRSLSAVLRITDESCHWRGVRVSQYADVLAVDLMLNEELREDLRAAALLHEISVITSPERAVMNLRSAQILSCFPELLDAADIVRFQGENFDGTGGPSKLVGEQIPIASRILRVAAEYDRLMQSGGPGRDLSHTEAIKVLGKGAGKTFDARVVDSLLFIETKERDPGRQMVRPINIEVISSAVH